MANQTFHGGINAPSVNGITPTQAAKLAALADAINVSGNLVYFLGDVFAPSFQPPNTWADSDFVYSTSGNSVTITRLTSTGYNKLAIFDGALLIPSTIGGNPVNTLNFPTAGTTLVSITIPASVTTISHEATPSAPNYTTVYYEGTLAQWCAISGLGLLLANYPNTLSVYIDGSQVTGSIVIPSGVTSISDGAFTNASGAFNGVTSIVIADTVTSIGVGSFASCVATSLSLGSGLTTIGNSAFTGCEKLPSVTIPASVTSIGQQAFYGCIKLATFNYAGTTAQWSQITLGESWNYLCPFTEVVCSDGTVSV